jgi:hypothetical protein
LCWTLQKISSFHLVVGSLACCRVGHRAAGELASWGWGDWGFHQDWVQEQEDDLTGVGRSGDDRFSSWVAVSGLRMQGGVGCRQTFTLSMFKIYHLRTSFFAFKLVMQDIWGVLYAAWRGDFGWCRTSLGPLGNKWAGPFTVSLFAHF